VAAAGRAQVAAAAALDVVAIANVAPLVHDEAATETKDLGDTVATAGRVAAIRVSWVGELGGDSAVEHARAEGAQTASTARRAAAEGLIPVRLHDGRGEIRPVW